jgi:hypothetical protein
MNVDYHDDTTTCSELSADFLGQTRRNPKLRHVTPTEIGGFRQSDHSKEKGFSVAESLANRHTRTRHF